MKNYKMIITYDGTRYYGWEHQPTTDMTIQGKLESVLSAMTGTEVEVIGAGRTDAGVHAIGQVANFKTNSKIPIEKIPVALNTKLKKTIRIINAEEVDERFHSRLSCKRKTYRYVINNSEFSSALYRNLECHIPQKLNIEKMQEAAKYFEGEHDFKSFCAIGAQVKTTVRTIYACDVEKEGDIITIRVTGNGFLYNMVRIIAGTLVQVGGGAIEPEAVKEILAKKDRSAAGPTAPAHGLTMMGIEFENVE